MRLRNLVLSTLLLTTTPAFAASGMCPTDVDRAHLGAFRDQIANAKTPEDAREMALTQTRLGHAAINRAARLFSESNALADAQMRLDTFDAGVKASTTQQEVAAQFDALLLTHPLSGQCMYTTIEIIVIIIGFVLGILPGILFLFLFC
jgi:hypothetical protein